MAPNVQRNGMAPGLGILLFVVCAGFPAMETAGFGFGIDLSYQTCLIIATVGGALGGLMMAEDDRIAGLVGGAVAGPCGLLGLMWYLQGRQTVHNLELVIVQVVASLPGVGVFFLLRSILGSTADPGEHVAPQTQPARDATARFRPEKGRRSRSLTEDRPPGDEPPDAIREG
jgi:hypothetical protein